MPYRIRALTSFLFVTLALSLFVLVISAQEPEPDMIGINITRPNAPASEQPSAIVLNNRSMEFVRSGDFPAALELLKQAAAADPSVAAIHLNTSIVYDHLKQPENALSEAYAAVRLDPKNVRAHTQACELNLFLGRYGTAVDCYEELQDIRPLDELSRAKFGVALMNSARLDRARGLFEQILTEHPHNVIANNGIGVISYRRKKYSAAVDYFKRALDVAPDAGIIRYNLGLAQLSGGNKPGALSQYRLLSEYYPKLAQKLYRVIYRDKIIFVNDK